LVSLDGSSLDVADTKENERAFGRPGARRGESAFPKLRFVALLENGTHVLWVAPLGPFATGEITLARDVVPAPGKGMLCLADRFFPGYDLWQRAAKTGADLLWRVRQNARLDIDRRLPDGSYLSRIYASTSDRRNQRKSIVVRGARLPPSPRAGRRTAVPVDHDDPGPEAGTGQRIGCASHERGEIETSLDELKTHLRGAQIVLRSKTPELVEQEFWGLLLAHFAIRGLMYEAALKADVDPDRLPFLHAVRVVQRRLARYAVIPPLGRGKPCMAPFSWRSLEERVVSSRNRINFRGGKRR
jgi:hypothetical protein